MEAAFSLEYVVDELSQYLYCDEFLTLALSSRRDDTWRCIRLEICSCLSSIQTRLASDYYEQQQSEELADFIDWVHKQNFLSYGHGSDSE